VARGFGTARLHGNSHRLLLRNGATRRQGRVVIDVRRFGRQPSPQLFHIIYIT
jgi:hypothetical protein